MPRFRKSPTLLDEILDPIVLVLAQLHFAARMYGRAMATARPQDEPYLRPWKLAKDTTWLLSLVLMYLQYYFMDVLLQIETLPKLDVNILAGG